MTARLWIVRHGNTFDKGDVVTRVGGRTDLALSASGVAQAEALAAHFAATEFKSATTSPLLRTRQTAETILSRQPAPPPLNPADFLREIDYGPDENRPEPDVIARIGVPALEAWEQGAIPPPGWIVDSDALIAGWRGLLAEIGSQPGDHLVVTSNGIARFALCAIGAGDRGHALKLPTGGFGMIVLNGEDATLDHWGERP